MSKKLTAPSIPTPKLQHLLNLAIATRSPTVIRSAASDIIFFSRSHFDEDVAYHLIENISESLTLSIDHIMILAELGIDFRMQGHMPEPHKVPGHIQKYASYRRNITGDYEQIHRLTKTDKFEIVFDEQERSLTMKITDAPEHPEYDVRIIDETTTFIIDPIAESGNLAIKIFSQQHERWEDRHDVPLLWCFGMIIMAQVHHHRATEVLEAIGAVIDMDLEDEDENENEED